MDRAASRQQIEIISTSAPEHMDTFRELFREYQQAIGIDLCFQSFNEELAGLPGRYAPPRGELLLALAGQKAVGCVALRPLADDACEMKRLYVRPEARGHDLGRKLIAALIAAARARGYRLMRLDTLPGVMDRAIALYREFGFREISNYNDNPFPGVVFMELTL